MSRSRYEAYGYWAALHDTELDRQERIWKRACYVLATVSVLLICAHVVVRFA